MYEGNGNYKNTFTGKIFFAQTFMGEIHGFTVEDGWFRVSELEVQYLVKISE